MNNDYFALRRKVEKKWIEKIDQHLTPNYKYIYECFFFFFCLFSCINTADITLFRGGKHWWFREGVKSSIGWPVKRVLREIKTKNNDCWWEFVVSCLVDGRVDQVPIYFSSICCLEFSFVFESSISLQDEGNKGKKKNKRTKKRHRRSNEAV